MSNAIHWFEIPVKNIDNAAFFYSEVLDADIQVMEAMGMKTAFFPADFQNGDIGGCLMQGPGYEPSSAGSIIYLNGGDNLLDPLSRVEEAGGKILMSKTQIPNGFMAHFEDSEGNRVGFFSPN